MFISRTPNFLLIPATGRMPDSIGVYTGGTAIVK
jgi:hypothetical protein